MHQIVLLASVAALVLSGCMSPEAALADLQGDGPDFSQAAAVVALPAKDPPTVPAIKAEGPAEPAAAPTDSVESTAPAEEPEAPAASNATDEPEPATNSTIEEPAPVAPCRDIAIDEDGSILKPLSYSGTTNNNQVVSARYELHGQGIVRSGVAVGLDDTDDFCQLEDAYPCVWSDAYRSTDDDPRDDPAIWKVHFGFTNVEGGPFHNDHDGYYSIFDVRAWVELEDGTLVLDGTPSHAMWSELRVRSGTAAQAELEQTDLCDVQAVGLLAAP